MDRVLALALASMHQDMNRLDVVAHNLANATTPGYKRQVVTHPRFGEVLAEATEVQAAGADPAAPAGPASRVLTDARAGTLKVTGRPLDLALEGDGWFEVLTDAGPAYTRQGDLRVDARGRLVTAQGFPVMGRGGEIVLTTPRPVVDAAGNVTEPEASSGPAAVAPGTPVAQLKVVKLANAVTAPRLGNGLVASQAPVTLASEGEVAIRQGALENANVSSMQEMVQLMETMRHFESMQKVAQGYDEMLGAAIRTIGEMS